MNDDSNPYAPPQEISTAALSGADEPIPGIRRRSVLLMIVLTLVTLGLYINYWTHRTALAINNSERNLHVSMGAVVFFWILSVMSLLWIVPEILTNDAELVMLIGKLLERGDLVMTIIMAFAVRSQFNALFYASRGGAGWFHGLWTFLFGAFYLQFRLNRNLRQAALIQRLKKEPEPPSFDFLEKTEQAPADGRA